MSFNVIVADPPWELKAGRPLGKYIVENGRQLFGPSGNTARPLAYPTMTISEIAALRVRDVVATDAHLYLWTVNRYVEDAFHIAREWGFDYSTMLTWAKNPMGKGLGGTYGISTEFCLFCRRGTLPALQDVGTTWFNWKRPYKNGAPNHSAKPPEFYKMVEDTSPGVRLEMFARKNREG